MNMRYFFLALLLMGMIQACTPSTKENPADRILFSSTRNGNTDIYLMNERGGEVMAITSSESEEWSPTWMSEKEVSFLRQKGDTILRFAYDLENKTEREIKHPEN